MNMYILLYVISTRLHFSNIIYQKISLIFKKLKVVLSIHPNWKYMNVYLLTDSPIMCQLLLLYIWPDIFIFNKLKREIVLHTHFNLGIWNFSWDYTCFIFISHFHIFLWFFCALCTYLYCIVFIWLIWWSSLHLRKPEPVSYVL